MEEGMLLDERKGPDISLENPLFSQAEAPLSGDVRGGVKLGG